MKASNFIFSIIILLSALLVGCTNGQKEEVSIPKEEAGQATAPAIEEPSQETLVKIENVDDFSLDIKFQNGDEVDYEYEVKTDHIEAEIEKTTGGIKEDIIGEQALVEIQSLIDKVKPTSNQTGEQLANQFLQALNLKREDIKAFELEIRFSDGKKIDYEF